MAITRRVFLKNGALAVVGTSVIPSFLTRAVYAADTAAGGAAGKRLVVLFQRGAADGLNIVVPFAERAYYSMRPSIAIPMQNVIDLDGFFGLHPSMTAFKPLWDQKHLAIVHAAGSPDTTRSHFDAQDYMESGTPGVKSTEDGWLNRAIAGVKEAQPSPFRAVAMGGALPRTLAGPVPAVAMADIRAFAVGGRGPGASVASNTFEAMYEQSVDTVLHGTGNETFEAVRMLKSADPEKYTPVAGAEYPRGRFGDSLRQVAQLIKANLGVEVAFADIGGWDHHVNEGSVQGQIANLTREFSQAIAAFWTDLGDLGENTVIVSMSEFGRTARENGNRGTDHGHANVMFVLGGPVKGGRVYGRWPGLATEHLYEGRDLAVTTDFRQVLSEAVYTHLGSKQLQAVFPGFEKGDSRYFLNYLG
ncbi:MAG TPA: DUF1501 domain-containing protein [Candidatus Angelobacter sp.]|nr:DUF1501 domain-containing protein [Candidatus Angelobacter sp.]